MDPKPRPNHRRYIEILRRMTPEQRLAKAFELSDRESGIESVICSTEKGKN